jgi:hypothetical protein
MSLQNGKPLAQYGRQLEPRRCAYPGCGTNLSRYNPNPCCGSHGGWLDADDRRNRDIL